MSKTVNDVTLLELLPENLRKDPDIQAACAAVDPEYRELINTIKIISYITDVDKAPSWLVDHLAVTRNVDFYDQTLPLATRRKLVKNAFIYKMFKGTPFAVKQILADAYETADLREWFNYGGNPYCFKVVISEALGPNTEDIIKAIMAVKNTRSHFDGLSVAFASNIPAYIGVANRQFKHHILPGPKPYEGYTTSVMGVVFNLE